MQFFPFGIDKLRAELLGSDDRSVMIGWKRRYPGKACGIVRGERGLRHGIHMYKSMHVINTLDFAKISSNNEHKLLRKYINFDKYV